MHRLSIAKKWILYTFAPVAVMLIVAVIMGFIGVRSYFYNETAEYLNEKSNIVYREASDSGFGNSAIKEIITTFADKEKVEIMSLDYSGRIITTSSGFYLENTELFPDFKDALSSLSSRGTFSGVGQTGERIMAVTVMLPESSSNVAALRLITSLTGIDKRIGEITNIFVIAAAVILLLFALVGIYFIRSIVKPIKEVAFTADKIAGGEFEYRTEPRTNDEIGDLCVSVNHMAEELGQSDKMQNEFISSVSHELRTPLTAIQGWVETLSTIKDSNSEEYRTGMHIITGETERLSVMVEELLDFSRIRLGRLAMNIEKIDLVAELTDAYLMFKKRAESENKTIEYAEPDEIIMLKGDRYRLKQVFVNIIDNAIKYSEEGTTISIKVFHDEETVTVQVIDNGRGIDGKDLPFVKKKFYRVDHSTKGSGIGLAVSDEIVELHGGTLDIKSEKNVGTVVTVVLPINPEDDSETGEQTDERA